MVLLALAKRKYNLICILLNKSEEDMAMLQLSFYREERRRGNLSDETELLSRPLEFPFGAQPPLTNARSCVFEQAQHVSVVGSFSHNKLEMIRRSIHIISRSVSSLFTQIDQPVFLYSGTRAQDFNKQVNNNITQFLTGWKGFPRRLATIY